MDKNWYAFGSASCNILWCACNLSKLVIYDGVVYESCMLVACWYYNTLMFVCTPTTYNNSNNKIWATCFKLFCYLKWWRNHIQYSLMIVWGIQKRFWCLIPDPNKTKINDVQLSLLIVTIVYNTIWS